MSTQMMSKINLSIHLSGGAIPAPPSSSLDSRPNTDLWGTSAVTGRPYVRGVSSLPDIHRSSRLLISWFDGCRNKSQGQKDLLSSLFTLCTDHGDDRIMRSSIDSCVFTKFRPTDDHALNSLSERETSSSTKPYTTENMNNSNKLLFANLYLLLQRHFVPERVNKYRFYSFL